MTPPIQGTSTAATAATAASATNDPDLLKVGVPAEQIGPLLQLFRTNVDHLNKLRVHTVCKKQGFVDVATILVADEEG